jgi:hypothetical protein
MNQEELNKLERKRKTAYLAILTINIAIGILIATIISFELLDISSPNFKDFFIALIAILIFVEEYIKNLIIKEISKAIYEPAFKEKNAEFNYDDGLTLDEVMSSELLPHPDSFKSNALIKGEISGFPYKASNITLLEEHEETDDDGSHTSTTVIFDGRMYIIETPFNKRKEGYKKVKLESGQFNEYFDIETQDQVELRKTLTPAVMEKLINLRNSIGEFHLSIMENKIFFAFQKSFDIKYNKPIQELIQEAKNSAEKEIKTIKSIIEALKLEEEKIKKGMANE